MSRSYLLRMSVWFVCGVVDDVFVWRRLLTYVVCRRRLGLLFRRLR